MIDQIKAMFTERDNATYCPLRIGGALFAGIYHAAAAVGCWTGQIHPDIGTLGQYLQHMSLFVGAGGLSIWAKSVMLGDAPGEQQ